MPHHQLLDQCVIRGIAIPVAWQIQRADQKGKWNPIWQDLLSRPAAAVDNE